MSALTLVMWISALSYGFNSLFMFAAAFGWAEFKAPPPGFLALTYLMFAATTILLWAILTGRTAA